MVIKMENRNNDNIPAENAAASDAARKNKLLKRGGYSLLVCVLVAAAVIAVNVLAGLIPSSVAVYDTSTSGTFTVSEGSEEILRALDEDVTIYLLAPSGNENLGLSKFLDRYQALSGHVTFKKIDPVLYPEFASGYTDMALNENSLIVESAKRSKVIDYTSIYVENPVQASDGTTTYESLFRGETEITSAVDYVTSDDLPTVLTLSGHGETELDSMLRYYLSADNYNVSTLDLTVTPSIPEGTDVIVSYLPTSDLTTAEYNELAAFRRGGGHFILITDYATNIPGSFVSITEEYGLEYVPGLVVEGNSGYYTDSPYLLLPRLGDNGITAAAYSAYGNFYVLVPQAHGITLKQTEGVNQTVLLQTSSSAYTKTGSSEGSSVYEKDPDSAQGPFALGVLAEESSGGGIIWFSSAFITDSSVDSYVSGGNSAFLMTMFSQLCGKKSSVSVASKSIEDPKLTVSGSAATAWGVVLCGVIPAAFIAGGIIVAVRRKKR